MSIVIQHHEEVCFSALDGNQHVTIDLPEVTAATTAAGLHGGYRADRRRRYTWRRRRSVVTESPAVRHASGNGGNIMKRSVGQWSKRLLVLLAGLTLNACVALETTRNVYVNGDRQNAFGAAAFDQQAGVFLPDGRYWANWLNGDWGVEGNSTVLGNTLMKYRTGAQSGGTANRSSSGGSTSNSVNGTAGTGRGADGRDCAFVSIPNGDGVMTCN